MSHHAAMQELVTSLYGLKPLDSWPQEIVRGADVLGEKYKLSPQDLLSRMRASSALAAEMAGFLTVGETYFWRYADHFAILAAHVRQHLTGGGRIWSAGCSSGEEPYSIAIALRDAAAPNVAIDATDIATAAVDRARSGTYGPWSFRGAPDWLLPRYFSFADNLYTLAAAVRAQVSFDVAPLLEHAGLLPSNSLDVIFFRNVAIYFESGPLEQKYYREMLRLLRPGGLMFLAPTDPAPGNGFECVDLQHGVYSPRKSAVQQRPRRAGSGVIKRAAAAALHPEVTAALQNKPSPVSAAGILDRAATMPPAELERALAAASAEVKEAPTAVSGYLVRGKLLFAAQRDEEAISDLRRCLFLAPSHRVARYWYAVVLLRSQNVQAASKQLRELQSQVEELVPDAVLEDGTRVRDLRNAIRTLLQDGL